MTAEVDGDLPWVDDVPRALGADEVAVLHLEEALDLLLDVLNGEILRSSAGKMVFKQRADIGDGEVGLIEERHLVNHLGDGAFQLSYVGARVFRYVHLNILGDDEVLPPSALRYSLMKLLTMPSFVSISGGWMSMVPPWLNREW